MTNRPRADIVRELEEIQIGCYTNSVDCPEGSPFTDRWMDMLRDANAVIAWIHQGTIPSPLITRVHAQFRSLELEQMHHDIEMALKDGRGG